MTHGGASGAILRPVSTPSAQVGQPDPRVRVARKVVGWLGVAVGIIMLGMMILGAYTCATDRPAREMFFEPMTTDEPPALLRPL